MSDPNVTDSTESAAAGCVQRVVGPTSLAEALPKEIERCMELCEQYNAIGPAGLFGYTMIRLDITAALKAMAEQDVVAMIRAYEALKGCK